MEKGGFILFPFFGLENIIFITHIHTPHTQTAFFHWLHGARLLPEPGRGDSSARLRVDHGTREPFWVNFSPFQQTRKKKKKNVARPGGGSVWWCDAHIPPFRDGVHSVV